MQTFSTDGVPASRRFDYWCELVSNNLVSVSIDRETRDPFFGSLLTCEIGESRLLSVRSTSQRIVRTGQRISQDRKSLYLLNYVVEGRGCTSQHGNFRDIGAGDFFIHDSSSVGDLRMVGPFEVLTLSLSKSVGRPLFCAGAVSMCRSAVRRTLGNRPGCCRCAAVDHGKLPADARELPRNRGGQPGENHRRGVWPLLATQRLDGALRATHSDPQLYSCAPRGRGPDAKAGCRRSRYLGTLSEQAL